MKKRYSIINYNQNNHKGYDSDDIADILEQLNTGQTTWITIHHYKSANKDDIDQLLAHFNVTSISAEQILAHHSIEFMGEYNDCLYSEFNIPFYDIATQEIVQVEGSMLLGKHFLLLFAVNEAENFDRIKEKLLINGSSARRRGIDYLLYLLIRALITIIDDALYRTLVEQFEILEDEVIASNGEPIILDKILAIREQVKPFYEAVRHLAVFVSTIHEEDSQFISKQVGNLFSTNLKQDVDTLWEGYERLRHWVTELMDIHRANIGERTNRVMHILTIVSTIFLPITFLASLYGMNFQNMSFLKDPSGYDKTLGLMVFIVVIMVIYMKLKKWV